MANAIDVTSIFAGAANPEALIKSADALQQSLVSSNIASREAASIAAREQQEQDFIVKQEQQRVEQQANKKAMEAISVFDTDEVKGMLARDYRDALVQSSQLHKQYNELSKTSFLDNPIEWLFNQFQKDSIAEQANSLDEAAQQSSDALRDIAIQKDTAIKVAKAQASVLTDTAVLAATKRDRAAADAIIAETDAKLMSQNINDIDHLRRGAYDQISLAKSNEQMAMERARFAQQQAHFAEWQAGAGTRKLKEQLELAHMQAINEEDKLKIAKLKEAADDDSRIGGMVAEGMKVVGLKSSDNIKELSKVYSKDQLSTLLAIGSSKLIDGSTRLGGTPGEAFVNLIDIHGKPPAGSEDSTWKMLLEAAGDAKEAARAANVKGAEAERQFTINYINDAVAGKKGVMTKWARNAEATGSLLKPSAISAIIHADESIERNKAVRTLLDPLTAEPLTNTQTDADSIIGRAMAAVRGGELSEQEAIKAVADFYTSAVANNHVYKHFDAFGISSPSSYTIRYDDEPYDMTKPEQVRRLLLQKKIAQAQGVLGKLGNLGKMLSDATIGK